MRSWLVIVALAAECRGLEGSYAAKHLTLHGLWPNYTDAEVHGRQTYPQFCGDYAHCKAGHDASCEPDPKSIPEDARAAVRCSTELVAA